jgi:hypothetical protein
MVKINHKLKVGDFVKLLFNGDFNCLGIVTDIVKANAYVVDVKCLNRKSAWLLLNSLIISEHNIITSVYNHNPNSRIIKSFIKLNI